MGQDALDLPHYFFDLEGSKVKVKNTKIVFWL